MTTSPLDLLERGDLAATDDHPVIQFSGKPWFVRSFVGDKAKGAMLVTAALGDQSFEGVVRDHLLAAINVAVMATDWKTTTPDQVAEGLAGVIELMVKNVHRQHMMTLASRKSS